MSTLAAGALAASGGTSHAATACQLLRVAELQVTMADNAPLIPASIDGHTVQMLADTGAATSLIWRSAAKELGLDIRQGDVTFYGAGGHDEAGLVWVDDFALAGATIHHARLYAAGRGKTAVTDAGVAHGIAGKSVDTSVALFPTLSVGDESVRNVELHIGDLFTGNTASQTGSHLAQHVTNDPEMLIGADFFLSHRIYVARSQRKMYFTYKGGPIFRRKAPEPSAPAAPAPP